MNDKASTDLPTVSPLLVFSQRTDRDIDIATWNSQAARFFGARLVLEAAPREVADGGATEARLRILPDGAAPSVREIQGRTRDDRDLLLAQAAEERSGTTGLALLARRCPTVWVVERERTFDAASLRIAAVLASILLGPIFDPVSDELFGVKTARAKLERDGSEGGRSAPNGARASDRPGNGQTTRS